MIAAGDFRNGITFEMDGTVYQVLEFQHVKSARGGAIMRTKIRDLIGGTIVERTFNPTEKFKTAYVERKEMAYSYKDDDLYYFMDPDSYEMIPVNEGELGEGFEFVKEGDECRVLSFKNKVFAVEPPTMVTLEVIETEPGIRGDTATSATKEATVETGATVRVPLFIDRGEKIVVDTRTGAYSSRA